MTRPTRYRLHGPSANAFYCTREVAAVVAALAAAIVAAVVADVFFKPLPSRSIFFCRVPLSLPSPRASDPLSLDHSRVYIVVLHRCM